jgi:hypothetical protein
LGFADGSLEDWNVADRCLEFWMLARLADGSPSGLETKAWQAHITVCSRCQIELDGIRATASQLAALGAAEHARAQASVLGTWNRVQLAAERPALATRLPMRAAGFVRDLVSVAHPALAGAAVAMVAGLAAGTWLAVTIDRSPTTVATAVDMYDASNLLDAASTGLATRYFDTSDATVTSNGDASVESPAATAGDSTPGGRP